MPAMPRDMSWLSPKRRRTTGNLKGVENGQAMTEGETENSPPTPTTTSPKTPSLPAPEKRPKASRPASQPQIRRAITTATPAGAKADGDERQGGVVSEMKREAKEMRNEVQRLEEHFEGMMQAVEKNTEKVAKLAGQHAGQNGTDYIGGSKVGSEGSGITYFDMDVLSGHFGRMNELLAKNNEHIDTLVRKNDERGQQVWSAIQTLAAKETNHGHEIQQLSAHLDRIQHLMEASANGPKDSGNDLARQPPQQIDFSPVTDRLEKVQEAVEQNSALVKALLDEGGAGDSKPGTPFWGKEQPAPDLLPLTAHLERIHTAIEQQSAHAKALAAFAGGAQGDPDGRQPTSLSPLVAEHLEQIYNAVEEGNQRAIEGNEHLRDLVNSQNATREAIENNGGDLDFTPVAEHLDSIREASDTNTETMKSLLEVQHSSQKELDLTPLTDRLKKIHSTLEKQSVQNRESSPGAGSPKFIMDALSSHLSRIQAVTEQNASHVKTLREERSSSQDTMQIAISETSEHIRALATHQNSTNDRIAASERRLGAQDAQMRELMSGQREMVEVMHGLAKGIVEQRGSGCGHVVVPPPRKMGRKIVGYVYGGKEEGG